MDDQLFYLAIQSQNSQDMLDVATYFENEGEKQRAVTLYQVTLYYVWDSY